MYQDSFVTYITVFKIACLFFSQTSVVKQSIAVSAQ